MSWMKAIAMMMTAFLVACGSGGKKDAESDADGDTILDTEGDVPIDELLDTPVDTDMDAEEDTPVDGVEDGDAEDVGPDSECTTGPCCDGGSFRPDTYECDTTTEHRCTPDEVCDAELQSRVVHTFCSGTSAACDGSVVEDTWVTEMDCPDTHECDATAATCRVCPIGCNTTGCISCTWTWTDISCAGDGCPSATVYHAAVWMPEYGAHGKMLVFGGIPSHTRYGLMYDPDADDWEATMDWALGGDFPEAIWTGSRALTWYGSGRWYNPFADTSGSLTTVGDTPSVDRYHTAIWTGSEMIVWGGEDPGTDFGSRYDPAGDVWDATSTGTGCPGPRAYHTAVWTGSEMIVWGGTGTGVNSGGKYNPSTDTWQPTSTGTGCPSGRLIHSAVWTGEKMIVWGGSPWTDTGGIYEPVVDTWEATSTGTSVPVARADHVAIWTGNEMIVWGGETGSGGVATDTGGHYDPITDTWTSTATLNAPSARYRPTAAWTGSEMIVWGGKTGAGGSSVYLDDGKKYRCVP